MWLLHSFVFVFSKPYLPEHFIDTAHSVLFLKQVIFHIDWSQMHCQRKTNHLPKGDWWPSSRNKPSLTLSSTDVDMQRKCIVPYTQYHLHILQQLISVPSSTSEIWKTMAIFQRAKRFQVLLLLTFKIGQTQAKNKINSEMWPFYQESKNHVRQSVWEQGCCFSYHSSTNLECFIHITTAEHWASRLKTCRHLASVWRATLSL